MRQILSIALVICCSAVATEGHAQDLGTPVITPPMLETPQSANDLIVPPLPRGAVLPPVVAPVNSDVPQQAVPVAQAPQPESVPAPAPAKPSGNVGSVVSTTAFGEWKVECFDPAKAQPACQATHRVVAGNGSQVVMVFAIAATAQQTSIQIALPLGISLNAAAQLIVGSGYQNKIAIGRCTPQGCIIEGIVSPVLLAAMRREKSGLIVVENETGEKIELPFSLMGFTEAYASLQS